MELPFKIYLTYLLVSVFAGFVTLPLESEKVYLVLLGVPLLSLLTLIFGAFIYQIWS